MTNRFRVEAWSLPLATSTKTVYSVPFVSGSYNDPLSAMGRGEISVRADWDRLSDVVDPDNGVGSKFLVYKDGSWIGTFFGHRTGTEIGEDGNKLVTIGGSNQAQVLEFARVENFDYPSRPSVEPDWNFGSGAPGGLENGGFEDQVGSTDFEDGKLDGWASARGGFFKSNQVGPDVDDADAQAGTFSLFWDPGPSTHSGVAKSFTVEGGGTYTFSVYLKSTVTGRRFVFGTEFPKGASSGTTNGYIWNGFLFAELDNVPRNSGKNGLPGGSTDGTWQQMILTITYPEFDSDPTLNTKRIEVAVQFDHHGGGSHPVARVDTFVASGPGLGLKPWHRTGNTSIVSVFEQSTDFVHGEDFSAKVTTTAADHGIAQVVDDLVSGRTYTYEQWVYHEDGSNQNFTVALKHETGGSTNIATNTVSVPTATWTLLDVTGITDDDDLVVVLRKQNASTFYADDARLYEGQPPESWGEINQQLLNDAAVDHIAEAGNFIRDTLGFLDYTSFAGPTDSDGNTWVPEVVEYRAVRGKRYNTIAEDGDSMGFEYQVLDDPVIGMTLDYYNSYDWTTRLGGVGTDRRTQNVPHIKYGPGVKAGPVVQQAMGANRIHAEGEDYQWDVRRDGTAIGDYDTREGYEGNVNLLGDDTLGIVADQLLDIATIPTTGIKVEIDPKDDPDAPQPYTDFFIGDTYPINLIGLFTGDKRVVNITTSFTREHGEYTVEFDQTSYTSDPMKAVVAAVGKLIDRFDELRIPASQFLTSADIDDHIHDKESIPTILVASNDAREEVRNMADFVCNGVDDQVEITAANDEIGGATGIGRILLSEGTFFIGDTGVFISNGVTLEGMNGTGTVLSALTDNPGTIESVVEMHSGSRLANLTIVSNQTNFRGVRVANADDLTEINNVWIAVADIGILLSSENVFITNCRIDSNTFGISIDGGDKHRIIGNWIIGDDTAIIVLGSKILRIRGNELIGGIDALVLDGTTESWITDNLVEANEDAIRLVNCDHLVVRGNIIDAPGDDGIFLDTCTYISVIGNEMSPVGEHAIHLTDTSDCLISGNMLDNPSSIVTNTSDGISLDGNSDNNFITGNKIKPPAAGNTPRYGINVSASTCDNNRIGDNDYGVLTDYGTFPLNDLGTGTKYPTARTADMSVGDALVIGTGVALYPFAEDSIYIDAHPTAGTAPSGGPVTVDINKNGTTSIYTTATNPSIASGSQVGSKAPGDQTLFAEDDYITLDLDAVNGAEDFTCVVRFLVG